MQAKNHAHYTLKAITITIIPIPIPPKKKEPLAPFFLEHIPFRSQKAEFHHPLN